MTSSTLSKLRSTGLALYLVSFFLPLPADKGEIFPGWKLAWVMLSGTFSPVDSWGSLPFHFIGLINPIVVFIVVAAFLHKAVRARKVLAIAVLIGIIFSWVLVVGVNLYLESAPLLWTIGMLLILSAEFVRSGAETEKPAAVPAAKPEPMISVAVPIEVPKPPPVVRQSAPRSVLVTSGPHSGQIASLDLVEFWIGAQMNNQLCLSRDNAVSGNHACMRREGDLLRLYDNQSLNDTWVNGKPIGTGVVSLQVGDRVKVGMSELFLQS